jgi:hypothetical protein
MVLVCGVEVDSRVQNGQGSELCLLHNKHLVVAQVFGVEVKPVQLWVGDICWPPQKRACTTNTKQTASQ